MIKFLSLLLLLSVVTPSVFADEPLNSVVIANKADQPEGWVCYDQPSIKKIDESMKLALDCQIDLKTERNKITALKKKFNKPDDDILCIVENSSDEKKFYQNHWVQLGAAAVLSFGLGLGIGLSL